MFLLFLFPFFIGIAIGVTGIGGILAIPALMLLTDVTPRMAMGTVLASLFLTSIIGTLNFRAMNALDEKVWKPLCISGFPAAFAGVWLNSLLPSSLLLFLLGTITIIAGLGALHTWRTLFRFNIETSPQRPELTAATGALAGLMAGLTGAGGPVLSIPILITLGLPPFPAVASGMPFQLATSAAGSAANLLHGNINCPLLIPVSVALALGVVIGNRLAPHVPSAILKKTIALFCLFTGFIQCIRTVLQ